MMKYNVIVRDEAWEMWNKHLEFATKVSKKFAQGLHNNLMKALKILEDNPNQFPLWISDFDLEVKYRRIIVKKRYLVIYYVDGNDVFVDYLFDTRMESGKYI